MCKGRKVLSLALLIARLALQGRCRRSFTLGDLSPSKRRNQAGFIQLSSGLSSIHPMTGGRPKPTRQHHRDHHSRPPRGNTPVITGAGKHTFPSRTRPLRPQPPMVVQPRCCARVGCRRVYQPLPLTGKRLTFWRVCLSGRNLRRNRRRDNAVARSLPSFTFRVYVPVARLLCSSPPRCWFH